MKIKPLLLWIVKLVVRPKKGPKVPEVQ